jgi:hypothetical protein
MGKYNSNILDPKELVYSTWKTNQPGERDGKAIYRHRSAPQPIHVLYPAGERAHIRDRVGVRGFGKVREEAAA